MSHNSHYVTGTHTSQSVQYGPTPQPELLHSLTNDFSDCYQHSTISDIRLKKNILPLDLSQQIQFIQLLKPVSFQWNTFPNLSRKQLGFIAQDVASTNINFEEIVNINTSLNPLLSQHTDSKGFFSPNQTQFSLNYNAFIPPLVSVVQHLLQQVDSLQYQIQQLQYYISKSSDN